MSTIGKSIETESKLAVVYGWRWGEERGVTTNGHGFFFGGVG